MPVTDEQGRAICEMCGTIYQDVQRRGQRAACPKCNGANGVNDAVLAKWSTDAQALLRWALDCRGKLVGPGAPKAVAASVLAEALQRTAVLAARCFSLLALPAATPAADTVEVDDEDEDEDEEDEEDEDE